MTSDLELLLSHWKRIGIEYDSSTERLIIADNRRVQGAIARQINNHGIIYEKKAKKVMATPSEVRIEKINPYLVLVEKRRERDIWNYALTQWRIPVSEGYGRRMRFLVFDEFNGKLIGLLGLSSPLYALGLRDKHIGWGKEVKKEKLKNIMTAYVLGAVYPYNQENKGSKLIAMLAQSIVVQKTFARNYSTPTRKQPLALIESFGGFGESPMYKDTNWQFLGLTKGNCTSHFCFPLVWDIIKRNADPELMAQTNIFTDKGYWRLRVIHSALDNLGLPSDSLINVGFQRAHYVLPLLENTLDYLSGRDFHFYPDSDSIESITQQWKSICF